MAPSRHGQQGGAALLLGVLLLALLSLVVTTAFSDNQWQLRVASRQIGEERALRAARSALGWAENWLLGQAGDLRPTPCASACAGGTAVLATDMAPADPGGLGENWWLDHAHADGFEPLSGTQISARSRPGTPPGRWFVEELHLAPAQPDRPATSYYRITARAARAPRGEPVVLETVIARPWGDPAWTDALPRESALSFCRGAGAPVHCGRLAWRRLR